ncbi:hypothetical protein D3C76_1798250 [compost metagenome]
MDGFAGVQAFQQRQFLLMLTDQIGQAQQGVFALYRRLVAPNSGCKCSGRRRNGSIHGGGVAVGNRR